MKRSCSRDLSLYSSSGMLSIEDLRKKYTIVIKANTQSFKHPLNYTYWRSNVNIFVVFFKKNFLLACHRRQYWRAITAVGYDNCPAGETQYCTRTDRGIRKTCPSAIRYVPYDDDKPTCWTCKIYLRISHAYTGGIKSRPRKCVLFSSQYYYIATFFFLFPIPVHRVVPVYFSVQISISK